MNMVYALISLSIMVLIYIGITRLEKDKKGLAKLFKGVIFQLSREMQLILQKKEIVEDEEHWRPFVICISDDTFKRTGAFDMVRWLAHRYGFGTYVHYIQGFLTKESKLKADGIRERLIKMANEVSSKVYMDTIISPSFTSAIAQTIQLPGVSGKGNNLMLFEFSENDSGNAKYLSDNYQMLRALNFDVCVLKSSFRGFGYRNTIHLWLDPNADGNNQLLVLLGYIILGHPEWKRASLKVFSVYNTENMKEERARLLALIKEGRLPISANNLELIKLNKGQELSDLVNQHSEMADLTIVGFANEQINTASEQLFGNYEENGNILFVNANRKVDIIL